MGSLEPHEVERFAALVAERFLARKATCAARRRRARVVLGPGAAAVLLHEAVAHSLEADVLATTGKPEAALGVRLGSACLNVLDDPTQTPAGERSCDDEGYPLERRWLVRGGTVEQLLADARWAGSGALLPGSSRRAGRHDVPGPRSTQLELLPGNQPTRELVAESDGGLYAAEARSGRLDPMSGQLRLEIPCARKIEGGGLGGRVGPFTIVGNVVSVLDAVRAVGSETVACGAGWCAKAGGKLPVWARSSALVLEEVQLEVAP